MTTITRIDFTAANLPEAWKLVDAKLASLTESQRATANVMVDPNDGARPKLRLEFVENAAPIRPVPPLGSTGAASPRVDEGTQSLGTPALIEEVHGRSTRLSEDRNEKHESTSQPVGSTATVQSTPKTPEIAWPPVATGRRLAALLTVAPMATQVVSAPTGPGTVGLFWNYARLAAIAWAIFSLAMAFRLSPGPEKGGPQGLSLYFLIAGLLYLTSIGLRVTQASYWRAYFVSEPLRDGPLGRLTLLTQSIFAGLLKFAVAAALVGVAFAVGGMFKK